MQDAQSIDPQSNPQSTIHNPQSAIGGCLVATLFLLTVPAHGHGTPAAPEKSGSELTVDHLRVEHDENPLGLGIRAPRLSWWIHGNARGIVQA